MRNLKKLLAVVVTLAMIITFAIPAFAADTTPVYGAQAQTLNTLGLYDGTSATSFVPDLGTAVDRETGVALLVKMLGDKTAALAMASADKDAALASYTDLASLQAWAKPYMAYAVKNGLVLGTSTTTVGATDAMTGSMYATLILRNLGYTVTDVTTALATLQAKGGLTADQATAFNKSLTKDDIVGISFGALKAADSKGNTLTADLIAAKVFTQAQAVTAGVASANASSATAAATGASKLTVTFDGPVADTSKATFTVIRDGGVAITVTPTWSADKKSVNLVVSGKLIAGDYAITVKGVASTDITANVAGVKDEALAKLTLNSTQLAESRSVGSAAPTGLYDQATITYKAFNQLW